jgi:hypothetical protein
VKSGRTVKTVSATVLKQSDAYYEGGKLKYGNSE